MKRFIMIAILFGMNPNALALDSAGNGPTRAAATALYVFNPNNAAAMDPATMTVKDQAANPLNLQVVKTGTAFLTLGADYVDISDNLIRSTTSADKIVTACKASNEMTLEMWVQSSTPVFTAGPPAVALVNQEDEDNLAANYFKQSVRLVSLADLNFKEFHNFGMFQAYNMGDTFKGTSRTTQNGRGTLNYAKPDTSNLSGDFIDPLLAPKENFLLGQKQHLIFVRSAGGVAKMYMSDPNGLDSLVMKATTGFGGDFSNWHKSGQSVTFDTPDDSSGSLTRNLDMRLGVGNEPSAEPDFGKPKTGGEGPSKHSRNWPFKGRIYMMAIYCKALSDADILGSAAPQSQAPPTFSIDVNRSITASMTKAQTIYTRMTGVKTPIDNPLIIQMANLIDQGSEYEAADLVTQDPVSGSNFYNITVRDMAAKMSTREEDISTVLNDFTATVIGATRDGLDARTLLTDNIIYAADPRLAAVPSDLMRDKIMSNSHYQSLATGDFDLAKVLVRQTQKISNGTQPVDNPDAAGLLTSRAWMAAHAIAGTNRRLVEYSFREFMCTPLESWADSSGSDSFVGRDVDRFPGGSHTKFTQSCRNCHSRMDPLRGAFAYYTFSNNMIKNTFVVDHLTFGDTKEDTKAGAVTGLRAGDPALTQITDLKNVNYVVEKLNHNDTVFPGGRVVLDSSFTNSAAIDSWGQNYFGWHGPTSGSGVKAFGSMLANSDQFARCMAKRAFAAVCKRQPEDFDSQLINDTGVEFTKKGYKLDYLFKKMVTTTNCLGEKK